MAIVTRAKKKDEIKSREGEKKTRIGHTIIIISSELLLLFMNHRAIHSRLAGITDPIIFRNGLVVTP